MAWDVCLVGMAMMVRRDPRWHVLCEYGDVAVADGWRVLLSANHSVDVFALRFVVAVLRNLCPALVLDFPYVQ
jgi:hypothetical protein